MKLVSRGIGGREEEGGREGGEGDSPRMDDGVLDSGDEEPLMII